MQIISALCIGHVNDLPGQQTDEVDSLFTVGQAIVFPGDDRAIKNAFATDEVEAMVLKIAVTFRFIPCHHAFECIHKKQGCNEAGFLSELTRFIDQRPPETSISDIVV